MTARTARLDEIEPIDVAGVHWRPLRRTLGITAFRTNAYSASAGEQLIEPHSEDDEEEMYVVVAGHATFTVAGEEIDAPTGTVVVCPEPADHRSAVAIADDTLALAVGNRPGAAGPPSAWEHRFAATPAAEAGDHEQAYAIAAAGLEDHPDEANLLYDLACYAALAGNRERALEHWRQALAANPRARQWAAEDPSLDSIRDAL